MNSPNFHWQIYKNLEQELIELSFNISFDDVQFEYILAGEEGNGHIKTPPYSLKTSDLLVRCCIEGEALIQAMTTGCEAEIKMIPSFNAKRGISIANRAMFLNDLWNLDKKIIFVSASGMYFEEEANQAFAPFCYNKGNNNDFITAYNTIKHNRNKDTIHKGNIRILLRAMAALYLLNIYYNDKTIELGHLSKPTALFDNRLGSDLFAAKYSEAQLKYISEDMSDECIRWSDGDNPQESTYIVKYTDETFKKMHKAFCADNDTIELLAANSQVVQDFLKNNPNRVFQNTGALLLEAGGIELARQILSSSHEFAKTFNYTESEAIVNKNQSIYPSITR